MNELLGNDCFLTGNNGRPQPRPAQHLLAAGAVDGADGARRLGRSQHRHRERCRPGISLIVFLAGAFGLMFAIEKTKNSAAGVPCCSRSRSSWA